MAVLLAAAGLAAVSPGASAAGGSRLLIETCFQPPFGDLHSEFHTVLPSGRDLRRVRRFPTLGPNDCSHRYPNWSPDGSRVAYMSGDAIAVGPAGWRRAWRRDRIVTPIGMWPAWSPSGRRLAFIRREAGVVNSLSVVSAAGGRVRRLVETNDSLEWPSWSADGRHVLYSTNMVSQPGQIQMWRVSAAGGRQRPLGRGRSADMAPDGKIAFITGHAVWTMNADGSGRRRIVSHSARSMVWRLAWSPDGSRIAYVFYPVRTGTVSQVRIVGRSGRGRRVVDLPRRIDTPVYVHWGS